MEVELGTFAAMALGSAAPVLFYRTIPILIVISIVLLVGMALMMFAGYEVVVTKDISQYNTTTTTNTLTRNTTSGSTMTNSTQSESQVVPAHTETTPIINSNQEILGWIFFGFGILFMILIIRKFLVG